MNTDCAFWIGKTHSICQDYALAGKRRECSYVILADGCSSSAETDIGARLLAKSAECLLPALPDAPSEQEAWYEAVVSAAADCACRLDLTPTCLDATLIIVKAENGVFTVSCYGDGIVALGKRDGSIEVSVITYGANSPRYASYLRDETRRRQWAAQPGNRKLRERWLLTDAGAVQEDAQESVAAAERFTGAAADYRFVAVLSDGVQSFALTEQTDTSRATLSTPAVSVLAELLAFKSGQGKFVQRRAQAFRKECRKRGWHHSDDVALGAVWLGGE